MQILTLAQLVNVSTGAIGTILMMTDYARQWTIASSIGFLTLIGTNVLLSPTIGLVGAALGTFLGLLVMFTMGVWIAKKELGIWPYDLRFKKGFISYGVSLFSSLLASLFPIPFPALKLGFVSIIAVFGFILPLFFLGADDEDRYLFDLLLSKIKLAT